MLGRDDVHVLDKEIVQTHFQKLWLSFSKNLKHNLKVLNAQTFTHLCHFYVSFLCLTFFMFL